MNCIIDFFENVTYVLFCYLMLTCVAAVIKGKTDVTAYGLCRLIGQFSIQCTTMQLQSLYVYWHFIMASLALLPYSCFLSHTSTTY